jgi:hypothetical protein
MLIRGIEDATFTEFLLLTIEDIDKLDEAQIQVQSANEATDIYYDRDGIPYADFLFSGVTFGILWERDDNPPTPADRFDHPFGYGELVEFIEAQPANLKQAMLSAIELYESTGVYPTSSSFTPEFSDSWERHAFTVTMSFGCLLQSVGKQELREFVY